MSQESASIEAAAEKITIADDSISDEMVVVKCSDGELTVPQRLLMSCGVFKNLVEVFGTDQPVGIWPLASCPFAKVDVFQTVVEYMKIHYGDSTAEPVEGEAPKQDDDKLISDEDKVFQTELSAPGGEKLFNVIQLANFIELQGLLNLACKICAQMIKGKNPEQLRQEFGIKNDFTPAEEEEVKKNNQWNDDPENPPVVA